MIQKEFDHWHDPNEIFYCFRGFFFFNTNISVSLVCLALRHLHILAQCKYLINCSLQALDVNKKLNCCTTVLSESFDEIKTISSKKEGLLYGVPVSIKENIAYKVLQNPISSSEWQLLQDVLNVFLFCFVFFKQELWHFLWCGQSSGPKCPGRQRAC